MFKSNFLGRRDEPSARPSPQAPLYPPKPDAEPLQAVAVRANHAAPLTALREPSREPNREPLRESDLAANAAQSVAAALLHPAAATASATSAGAAVSTSPGSAATSTQASNGPRLTVGPNIKLKGAEIKDCEILVVEGHVEASMDSNALEILHSGSYDGTVCVDVAEVHGKFSGNLTARKKLVVHRTGQVTGVVRYGSLLVSEGGMVSGDVASLDSKGEPQGNLFAGYPSSRGSGSGLNGKANGTTGGEHARS